MTEAGNPMTGVVTFLFTDIEGSTRLELALGTARYATVRERHRELLRAAFVSNGGTEQSTQGDSIFVLFESARSAIHAAIEGQRAPDYVRIAPESRFPKAFRDHRDISVGIRLGVVTQVKLTFLLLPKASDANRRATATS